MQVCRPQSVVSVVRRTVSYSSVEADGEFGASHGNATSVANAVSCCYAI